MQWAADLKGCRFCGGEHLHRHCTSAEALEAKNPGAAALVVEVSKTDLTEAAYRLSTSVPQIISLPFNPSASKSVLAAMLADVQKAMAGAHAEPWDATHTPLMKDDWLAWRLDKFHPA